MRNETLSTLIKIREAILDQKLRCGDVAISDIKDLTLVEMMDERMWFLTKEQMDDMVGAYTIAMLPLKDSSITDVLQAVNISVMAVSSIPQPKDFLWTKDWWKFRLKDDYNDEIDEAVSFMEKYNTSLIFNYEFSFEYDRMPVEVFRDEEYDRPYIMYKGKRMYFPNSWDEAKIIHYIRFISAEQDAKSPHCYQMPGYGVEEGDVVIDAGVAEGNFALDVIDKVKKIYLVEADSEWVETLKITFKDYMDKVVFVEGYLDSKTEGDHVALKDVAAEPVNYIKMDIEGFEKHVCEGAEEMLSKATGLKMAVCTYHEDGDEARIRNCLGKCGFEMTSSKGLMFPTWDVASLYNCRFRKGVLFAKKP